MRTITEIIVHCTATAAGREVTVAQVDAWHRQRGFNGIGYHYLVGLDGRVSSGRPLERIGAHCRGHNTGSIGIAYAGGLDWSGRPADTRTEAQRASLQSLIRRLIERYPTITRVSGHRDYAAKACPCFDARAEYGALVKTAQSD